MIFEYKNKKSAPIYFFLAMVFAIGLAGVGVENAKAATITVCPSGCDYTSIQDAIDAASSGDTISIGAGTYDEQVIVNKGLTLDGDGAGTTIIKPTQTTANSFQLFNRLSGGSANSAAIIVTDTTETVVIQDLKVDGSLGSVCKLI